VIVRTVIERDCEGNINLVVDGDSAPEAVAREYLRVLEVLFPKVEVAEAKPKLKVKEKEGT